MTHLSREIESFRARVALLATAMGLKMVVSDGQCKDHHELLVLHLENLPSGGLIVVHKDEDFDADSAVKVMDVVARQEFFVFLIFKRILIQPTPTFTVLLANGEVGMFGSKGVFGWWDPKMGLFIPAK